MEIIKEESITFSEAKEILEKKKDDKRYEISNALDHLKKFTVLSTEDVKKMKEELKNIKKLTEKQIVDICNFLPKTKDELRTILYKDYTNFDDSEINKIIEIVKKFG